MRAERLRLYGITDPAYFPEGEEEPLHEAIAGGMTALQLREKHLSGKALLDKAARLGSLCRAAGVLFLLDDDYRAALEIGADGVHVGAQDTPVAEIRRYAGKNFIIGATAKTTEQALFAQAQGADYLGVGAVFPSSTKPGAIRITPAQLRDICLSVEIPAVAIGGITPENASSLQGCGAAGLAVSAGLFAGEGIRSRAERLYRAAEALS